MTRPIRRRHIPAPALVVALLIGLAYGLRFLQFFELPGPLKLAGTLTRSGIYFGIFIVWGVSVSQRVIQPQIRRMFIAVAALMVFWMTVRTVRYLTPAPGILDRYCWYLYYIPMLFIPLLTTLVAACLGRPESYRLPRWTVSLCIAAALAALLVLTNDLHHMMFVFPEGAVSNDEYSYGAGYLLPAVWRYGGLLATLGLIFARSRLPGRGKRLLAPIVPAVLLVLYHLCYLLEFPWLRDIFGDLTVTECLLVVCILECGLRAGLIQSNTHYEELFRVSSGSAVIVDRDNNELIASEGYTPLPPDVLRRAEDAPVLLEGGLRLSSAPIQDGHVLWLEDISELMEVTAALSDRNDRLTEQVVVRQREVEARHREQALSERNRLYHKVIGEMRDTIALFDALTDELERCGDPAAEALLTARLAIACTQIKRSVNLVFIEESQGQIDAAELSYTIKEWLASLRLLGVRCDCVFELTAPMAFSDMLDLHGSLARILLAAADGLESMLIRVGDRGVLIGTVCGADLTVLEAPGVSVERDDEGGWSVELVLPAGRPPARG